MAIFFTSDHHFNHTQILVYAERPFKNVREMNDILIKRHNSLVKKNDLVFHLGDFCYEQRGYPTAKEFLNMLNGHFIFIKGNHDTMKSLDVKLLTGTIHHGGKNIHMVHNPSDARLKFKINLVGHIHKLWVIRKVKNSYLINVGVDVWNFCPITIEQILELIRKYDNNGVT